MAPLSLRFARAMLEIEFEPRSMGSENDTNDGQSFTPSQVYTLQCLALAFSTISVASAMLALYWFIKMRRNFRHDLIMLLIQSDMFKALWFMIYPAVVFTFGPVPSDSNFCQVSGFFLSVGIEASDVAILMIAIHSALYIFRPKTSSRERGLYPYRHFAYLIWVFFPITMASLAFVNGRNAYVDQLTYCYLPIRPIWYTLALAWIPRYIIFIAILSIYASIYLYVRKKFHGFDKESRARRTSIHTTRACIPQDRHTLPPTPALDCHGLISEPSRRTSIATIAETRKSSLSSQESDNGAPLAPISTTRFIWASVLTNSGSASEAPPSDELSTADSEACTGPLTPPPLPAYLDSSPSPADDVESDNPSYFRSTSWRDGFVSRVAFSPSLSPQSPRSTRSTADIFSVLRRGPADMSRETHTPASQLQLVNSRGQNLAVSEMLRVREKIRRQLRLSFIYPLVYMGMWVIPFAFHAVQYDDRMAIHPPFALTCITTIFICIQAAVDCWLFSTREKPWKHIHGNDGTFWGSLKFWSGWHGVRRKRRSLGPGKTRDEMVRDSRAAYKRREDELAQRKIECVQGPQACERRKERSWWEGAEINGATDATLHHNPEPGLCELSTYQTDLSGQTSFGNCEEEDTVIEELTLRRAHELRGKTESNT